VSQQTLYESVSLPMGESIPLKPVPYRVIKRGFDLAGAAVMLMILLPFFILIALAVKLSSRGPIFYSSVRIGRCGRPFRFVKFRSMYMDADKRLADLMDKNEREGPIFKMKHDPRVTPVGRFLRRYSLDELPQFIHVVRGEMSLVGPRPPLPREVQQYDEFARERLTVKPGITCYWQIMGRSNLSFDEWMELDHKYIREMSFWTDLRIIVLTPFAVLRGDGAY
jgi:lipopolysaccharide/colanic/teichoic acid biosynthesis glycosyltransferase